MQGRSSLSASIFSTVVVVVSNINNHVMKMMRSGTKPFKSIVLFCVLVLCVMWTVSAWLTLVVAPLVRPDPRFVFGADKEPATRDKNHLDVEKDNGTVLMELKSLTLTKKSKGNLPLVECAVSTPRQSTTAAASGVVHITARSDLSPIASQVFLDLVESRYYDGVIVFRVLTNFIAQWGVRSGGSPLINFPKPPKTTDKVTNQTLSNVRGTLSFAGGNPATRQVFVNLNDANVRLDKENSRPFATVDLESMIVFDALYTGYKDGQGQVKTLKKGEKAMLEQFPHMSRIDHCRVVP